MAGPIDTKIAANPLFCHQEFLEKLESHRNSPIGKRASLLMQHLAIDSRRQHYKSTSGVNQGWRRSRLGGNHGSHFYAWWAPAASKPLRHGIGFDEAPAGSIVLRDIRHHDDHHAVTPQDLQQQYLPIGVNEIRQEDFGPAPWTYTQSKFASARTRVRLLKGHPGSGKTTALLHAADMTAANKTLYVTYSRDLVAIARSYFDRYCSSERQFQVLTYQAFIREITGSNADPVSLSACRKVFQSDLANYARSLGPWSGETDALYDELHAHLVGSALPVGISRFDQCRFPRQSDKNYRQRRIRAIGEGAVNAVLEMAARLEKMDSRSLAERYFPELWEAWKAAGLLLEKSGSRVPEAFKDIGCLAVDECQDLTAIESFVLAQLSSVAKPAFLLAGDEAQTVRPTDFEWGWLNDILHTTASSPTEFKLTSNLRSPRRLALLVNRVWDLYATLDKRDRPSGTGYAEVEDDSTDQVFYCAAAPGEELDELLTNLAGRGGLALVSLDSTIPAEVPASIRGSVLTAAEVKGLDFHSVCVLNGGVHLHRIADRGRAYTQDVESLRRRLAIDQLRVALSRPTERLIWLDIAPKPSVVVSSLEFLNRTEALRVSQSTAGAVQKALDEEELDLEERIQRCLHDARQLLEIKPDLAWSRAMLAVTLLGRTEDPVHVGDVHLRETVHLTAAEVCFTLAMRGIKLSASLGPVDLFQAAGRQSAHSGNTVLQASVTTIQQIMQATPEQRPDRIYWFAKQVGGFGDAIPAWFLTEIQSRLRGWIEQLEAAVNVRDNAVLIFPVLLPFYESVRFPEAAQRVRTLREKTLQMLVKSKRHDDALALIRILISQPETSGTLSPSERRIYATCLEKTGVFDEAAKLYEADGDLAGAIECYRQIPDIETAYALMRRLPGEGHQALESYDWIVKVREVFAKRPANFNKVMLGSEKKSLESLLEQGLGVQRKAPAKKIATAKKAAAVTKKPVATRKTPTRKYRDDVPF